MAIAYQEGSALISTTEYSLPSAGTYSPASPQTGAGIVQAFIDFNAMAAGDEFRIRIYEKARAADTQRLMYEGRLEGAQSQPLWSAPAQMLSRGWDVTVQKITGTDRTITWSVRRMPDA